MKRCLLILAVSALAPTLLRSADTPNRQDVINQLQQAVAKTNIFQLPSFAMKGTVQIENRGKPVEGTYQLLWNGPDQWKEELILPGYEETQIGGKGTIWVHRSTDFVPAPIYSVYQALGFGSNVGSPGAGPLVYLNLTPNDVIKKQRERKEHGNKLTCFEIENEQKHESELELCLNDSTGTIARNPANYLDEDLASIGEKTFPRKVSYLVAGKAEAKVLISELTLSNQFPGGSFAPPNGVAPQEGCMNPVPARLTKRVNPEYPTAARAQHVEGTVKTNVVIDLDGAVRIVKVVESPATDLESSATRALEGWHYDPATCNGKPVQISTILQVHYTLRH
jgi:protein TonB